MMSSAVQCAWCKVSCVQHWRVGIRTAVREVALVFVQLCMREDVLHNLTI
jgi:hypothetical protein